MTRILDFFRGKRLSTSGRLLPLKKSMCVVDDDLLRVFILILTISGQERRRYADADEPFPFYSHYRWWCAEGKKKKDKLACVEVLLLLAKEPNVIIYYRIVAGTFHCKSSVSVDRKYNTGK